MNDVVRALSFVPRCLGSPGLGAVGSRSLPVPVDPGEWPGYPVGGSPAGHAREPTENLPSPWGVEHTVRSALSERSCSPAGYVGDRGGCVVSAHPAVNDHTQGWVLALADKCYDRSPLLAARERTALSKLSRSRTRWRLGNGI
jgi:hypothetical protein